MTPLKKGAASESARIRAFLKHPLAHRIVAGIRGVDIARYRDARLKMEVASITGHKDLRMLRRYTHLKAEDLAKKLG